MWEFSRGKWTSNSGGLVDDWQRGRAGDREGNKDGSGLGEEANQEVQREKEKEENIP